MDEIFKYLIVAAFIVYAVVKQARAGSKKDTDAPGPQESVPPGPLPENWGGDTTGGGWFDILRPQPASPKPGRKKQKAAARPASQTNRPTVSDRTTTGTPMPASPPEPNCGPAADIDISSAQEVRKGFIWSVILERKYD